MRGEEDYGTREKEARGQIQSARKCVRELSVLLNAWLRCTYLGASLVKNNLHV